MQVLNWAQILSSLEKNKINPLFSKGAGISVGSFDGLHLGHRVLLEGLRNACAEKNLVSVIITFENPLPGIKHPENYYGDISTLNQRLKIFQQYDVDFVILIDFNEKFAATPGIDFLNTLIKVCNMKFIIEGVDFRFGYKGATDIGALKDFAEKNGIDVHSVDQIIFDDKGSSVRVSSSIIRRMIFEGRFETVNQLLQKPYEIEISSTIKDFNNNSLFIERNDIKQVLPPSGEYDCINEKGHKVKVIIGKNAIQLGEVSKTIKFEIF